MITLVAQTINANSQLYTFILFYYISKNLIIIIVRCRYIIMTFYINYNNSTIPSASSRGMVDGRYHTSQRLGNIVFYNNHTIMNNIL